MEIQACQMKCVNDQYINDLKRISIKTIKKLFKMMGFKIFDVVILSLWNEHQEKVKTKFGHSLAENLICFNLNLKPDCDNVEDFHNEMSSSLRDYWIYALFDDDTTKGIGLWDNICDRIFPCYLDICFEAALKENLIPYDAKYGGFTHWMYLKTKKNKNTKDIKKFKNIDWQKEGIF